MLSLYISLTGMAMASRASDSVQDSESAAFTLKVFPASVDFSGKFWGYIKTCTNYCGCNLGIKDSLLSLAFLGP